MNDLARIAGRLISQAILIALALAGLVVAIGLGRGKANAAWTGEWLAIVGGLCFALATLAVVGGYAGRGVSTGLASTAGRVGAAERAQQAMADVAGSYRTGLRLALAGLILVVAGLLLSRSA